MNLLNQWWSLYLIAAIQVWFVSYCGYILSKICLIYFRKAKQNQRKYFMLFWIIIESVIIIVMLWIFISIIIKIF